ncbi:thioesterase family protein [Sciscionella sediminilitoris]|uniref:thioesterase family protein n=1 Tax=Sciscionella sediminilitoris TaxID=1445613 RepID=UPI0004DFC4EA|nr:thioesterase family protein [Sciscionella sp. SE31]
MDLNKASEVRAEAEGLFSADLSAEWSVGDKPHGGYLMAVLTRAALAAAGGDRDPLAVSCEFLRPPEAGPAELRTEVRKQGSTVSSIGVALEQHDAVRVTGTVTAGRLPDEEPAWAELPEFPVEPGPDALEFNTEFEGPSKIGWYMDTRFARHNASLFTDRKPGDPLEYRAWFRSPDDHPDIFFALVAGDMLPPLPFNLGHIGWSPTVQLTALLRAEPAPGWLRVQGNCRTVAGNWFDADATVIDSRGRLVCQARQLALLARKR